MQIPFGRRSRATGSAASAPHHWSDWAGFAGFTLLALALWQRSAEFGLAVIPGMCYELVVALGFLVRRPLRRAASGLTPRLVAWGHTFLPIAFLEAASTTRPAWLVATADPVLRSLGGGLWLAGALLAFWPLWYLRRAISIEPQARMLVTGGPYRLARHPIYAAYLLVNAGLWLRHPTLPFAVVLLAWVALLAWRIRVEERVLAAAFPQYADYRRRVGALGPRLALAVRPAARRSPCSPCSPCSPKV